MIIQFGKHSYGPGKTLPHFIITTTKDYLSIRNRKTRKKFFLWKISWKKTRKLLFLFAVAGEGEMPKAVLFYASSSVPYTDFETEQQLSPYAELWLLGQKLYSKGGLR